MTPQQALLKELSDLLGFEDGAEDVLEHLLTIDSSEVSLAERRRVSWLAMGVHSSLPIPILIISA